MKKGFRELTKEEKSLTEKMIPRVEKNISDLKEIIELKELEEKGIPIRTEWKKELLKKEITDAQEKLSGEELSEEGKNYYTYVIEYNELLISKGLKHEMEGVKIKKVRELTPFKEMLSLEEQKLIDLNNQLVSGVRIKNGDRKPPKKSKLNNRGNIAQ